MSEHESTIRPDADTAVSPPGADAPTPEGKGSALDDQMMREVLRAKLFANKDAPSVKIGRFTVLDRIGSGGMGVVYAAYDGELDRKVAIKLLQTDEEAGSEGRSRLLREAQAMAKLAHPNVCTVHEVGTFEGRVYIAMEFVRGMTVREWREEKERGWSEILDVFVQAGRGLAAAHAAGVVHRDFKPDNVIVGDDGRVRVLDFGLARPADVEDLERSYMGLPGDSASKPLDTPLTLTGALVGTPAYMSPEQHAGKPADERSDQFSFGVTLYEGLFGERPFSGDTMKELTASVQKGKVPDAPRGSKVPAFLRREVLRGLSPNAADRHPSMEALLRQLQKDPAAGRKRVATAVVAAVIVGFGAWGIYSAQQASAAKCTAAEGKLAGIWDNARKQKVREAMLASGAKDAEGAWTRVEKSLDAYTQTWVSMHTEACEATNVRGEQPAEMLHLRMACLERELTEVKTLVDVLAEADAGVAENAARAAGGLRPLDRCADTKALASRALLPEDPRLAANVKGMREKLARAKALQRAAKYKEGLALAQEVAAAATSIEYPPVEAEALLRLGELQLELGEYTDAEKNLEKSYWVALDAEHDEVQAESATQLVQTLGYFMRRPEEARKWGRHAEAAVRRVGAGGPEEGKLLRRMAEVALMEGNYDELRTHSERALEINEKTFGPDHPEVAWSLTRLGVAAMKEGKVEEARKHTERAVGVYEQALGPDHPEVGIAIANLGSILEELGEHDEAREKLERAVTVYERALGPDHFRVGQALHMKAAVLGFEGEHDEARKHIERALAINEKTFGPDHPTVMETRAMLGHLHTVQGQFDQAREHYERALGMLEKTFGSDHLKLASVLGELGYVLLKQERLDEARAHLERALEIVEKTPGAKTHYRALALAYVGKVDHAEGKNDEARKYLERGLATLEKEHGTEPSELVHVMTLTWLGEVLLDQKEPEKALVLLERAVARVEKGPPAPPYGGEPEYETEPRFSLARALLKTGKDKKRAIELAKRAHAEYKKAGDGFARDRAQVEAWLAKHGG